MSLCHDRLTVRYSVVWLRWSFEEKTFVKQSMISEWEKVAQKVRFTHYTMLWWGRGMLYSHYALGKVYYALLSLCYALLSLCYALLSLRYALLSLLCFALTTLRFATALLSLCYALLSLCYALLSLRYTLLSLRYTLLSLHYALLSLHYALLWSDAWLNATLCCAPHYTMLLGG